MSLAIALKTTAVWTALMTNTPPDVQSDIQALEEDFGNTSITDTYHISIPEMDLEFDVLDIDKANYKGPFQISESSARYRQWNELVEDHAWPVLQNKVEFTKDWTIVKDEGTPTPEGKTVNVNVYRQTITARQQWDLLACGDASDSVWEIMKKPCGWYAFFLGIDAKDYYYWQRNWTGIHYTNDTVLVSGGDPETIPVIGDWEIPASTQVVKNIHIPEVETTFDYKVTYADTTQHTFPDYITKMAPNPVYRDAAGGLNATAYKYNWNLGVPVMNDEYSYVKEMRQSYGFGEISEAGYIGQNVNIISGYTNPYLEINLRDLTPGVLTTTDEVMAENNIPEKWREVIAQSTSELGLVYDEEGHQTYQGCEVKIISDYWLNNDHPQAEIHGTICLDLSKQNTKLDRTIGLNSELFIAERHFNDYDANILIATVAAFVSQHPKMNAWRVMAVLTGTTDEEGNVQLPEAHAMGMAWGQAQAE